MRSDDDKKTESRAPLHDSKSDSVPSLQPQQTFNAASQSDNKVDVKTVGDNKQNQVVFKPINLNNNLIISSVMGDVVDQKWLPVMMRKKGNLHWAEIQYRDINNLNIFARANNFKQGFCTVPITKSSADANSQVVIDCYHPDGVTFSTAEISWVGPSKDEYLVSVPKHNVSININDDRIPYYSVTSDGQFVMIGRNKMFCKATLWNSKTGQTIDFRFSHSNAIPLTGRDWIMLNKKESTARVIHIDRKGTYKDWDEISFGYHKPIDNLELADNGLLLFVLYANSHLVVLRFSARLKYEKIHEEENIGYARFFGNQLMVQDKKCSLKILYESRKDSSKLEESPIQRPETESYYDYGIPFLVDKNKKFGFINQKTQQLIICPFPPSQISLDRNQVIKSKLTLFPQELQNIIVDEYLAFNEEEKNPYTIPKIILALKLHELIVNLEKKINTVFNAEQKQSGKTLSYEQCNLLIMQKGFLNQLAMLDLTSSPEDRKKFIEDLQKIYEFTDKNIPKEIKNFIKLIFMLSGDVDNEQALERQATAGDDKNISRKPSN